MDTEPTEPDESEDGKEDHGLWNPWNLPLPASASVPDEPPEREVRHGDGVARSRRRPAR